MIKHTVIAAAAVLALTCGTARAEIPNTQAAVLQSSQPLIVGHITAVSDQDITVQTDRDAQVTLLLDSRTMVPTDMAAGMPMRAQFRVMEDGEYYAQRITPIREDEVNPERPVAINDVDQNDWYIRHEEVGAPAAYVTTTTAAPSDDRDETITAARTDDGTAAASTDDATSGPQGDQLPQTSSHQTLLIVLGLGALASSLILQRMRSRFV